MALPFIGSIQNPNPKYPSTEGSGLFVFLSNILKFIGVAAGIFMVVQIITAGFDYINAAGDIKKTEAAWAKIWQSVLGLIIISSAFIIAGLVGRFTGINILEPTIYGSK